MSFSHSRMLMTGSLYYLFTKVLLKTLYEEMEFLPDTHQRKRKMKKKNMKQNKHEQGAALKIGFFYLVISFYGV